MNETNSSTVAPEVLDKIRDMIDRANGQRRVRTMTVEDAVKCVSRVHSGSPYSSDDGGTVANAYRNFASTTFVLAARVDGRIFLGVTAADANKTTPGRAWKALQPWRTGEGPAGDAETKWKKWTESADVIEISLDSLV